MTVSSWAAILAGGIGLRCASASPAEPLAQFTQDSGLAQRRARIENRMAELLEGARAQHDFPGACAAFVGTDGWEGAVAVGYTDAQRQRPMQVSDRLLSGSIGKSYVAAVALKLVGQDLLDLDSKVEELLGNRDWFARLPNATTITVRQLLNHTSGIPEHVWKPEFQKAVVAEPDRAFRPEQMIAYILDVNPVFEAGQGWSYADTNYLVLGLVIEEVGGRPYYDQLRESILIPLKLDDTIPSDRRVLTGLVNGFASGVAFHAGPTVVDGRYFVDPVFEWTGGGLASTTLDLARWCHALFTGLVIPAALAHEHLQGVKARRGVADQYGLGVIIDQTPHGKRYGHSGIMPGYLSQMGYYPDHQISVAIQFNTDDSKRLGMSLGHWADRLVELVSSEK